MVSEITFLLSKKERQFLGVYDPKTVLQFERCLCIIEESIPYEKAVYRRKSKKLDSLILKIEFLICKDLLQVDRTFAHNYDDARGANHSINLEHFLINLYKSLQISSIFSNFINLYKSINQKNSINLHKSLKNKKDL